MKQTFFLLLMLSAAAVLAQPPSLKPKMYLMPGFGSDARIFRKLHIEGYDTVALTYLIPEKGERLPNYARRMAAQIDTTAPFALLGVSFGGMLAIEMTKFLQPDAVVLIASAKTRYELPFRYRFQQSVPLNRLFTGRFMKRSGVFAARFFEPDMKPELDFFREMLRAKDDRFMWRAFDMIAHWENDVYPPEVLHLHGDKDHTLPVRRIKNAQIISGGSHWAVYLNAEEVSKAINQR